MSGGRRGRNGGAMRCSGGAASNMAPHGSYAQPLPDLHAAASPAEALPPTGTFRPNPPTANYRGQGFAERETYFREQGSQTIVRDLLEHTETPKRSGPLLLLAGGLAAVLLAGLAVFTQMQGPHTVEPKLFADPVPVVTTLDAATPAAAVMADATVATVVTPTRPVHVSLERPAAPSNATLIVRCTPWCVPFIDGKQRGNDGRLHTITLPAGSHKLSARRLDDHLERTLKLSPAQTQTIELSFD